jgi:8-oxo-dGTP diphosphatase
MQPVRIAVAVVLDAGRVLVGRRSPAATDAAGCDEFPGGKVEPGETPREAAARECAEETGLAIDVFEGIDTATARASSGAIEVAFFLARPREPAATPRPPYAWVAIADLQPARFPAANAGVLAWLRAGQGGS